jgi:ribosomal protein S13
MNIYKVQDTINDYWVECGNKRYYVKAFTESTEWDEVVLVQRVVDEDIQTIFKSDMSINPGELNVEEKSYTQRYIVKDMTKTIKDFEDNFDVEYSKMVEKMKWFECYKGVRYNK